MPHRLASRCMAWHGIGRASHSGEEGVTQEHRSHSPTANLVLQPALPNAVVLPALEATCKVFVPLPCLCFAYALPVLCLCCASAVPVPCLCCASAVPLLYHPPTAIFRTFGRWKTPVCLLYVFTSCFMESGCIRPPRPPRPPTTADNTQPQHDPAQTYFCHCHIHSYAGPRSCMHAGQIVRAGSAAAATFHARHHHYICIVSSLRPMPSLLRELLLPNAKRTGMAAPCQRHGSLTRVSKDSHNALLRDLASLSRGGGVARPRLIEL
jgi:hypothetical protein